MRLKRVGFPGSFFSSIVRRSSLVSSCRTRTQKQPKGCCWGMCIIYQLSLTNSPTEISKEHNTIQKNNAGQLNYSCFTPMQCISHLQQLEPTDGTRQPFPRYLSHTNWLFHTTPNAFLALDIPPSYTTLATA